MWIDELSSGYYVTEMYVESGNETAVINDETYRDFQYEIGTPGTGDDVIFALDGVWFPVMPSKEVPFDTLTVSDDLIDATRIKHPPTRREIMVPKPWFAELLKRPDLERSKAL